MAELKFEGWLGKGPEAAKGEMEWGPFEPKRWTEYDVDIEVSHCGVCGSDLHTLSSAWGPSPYPCVVGHEIVGRAVRVGNKVSHVKKGDRVGVGAQALSCQSCDECSKGKEQYCGSMVTTYGSVFPNDEGKSYGGYADYHRANGHFVIPIPDGIESADAAPMLCAGITVYNPLKNHGCGPGKAVGVVGVGGLGHFAVLFAKALGADRVVGISRRGDKRDEVLKLGADAYIATAEDEGWAAKNTRSLDLIINTVSSASMSISDYLGLLKVNGTLVQVGAPEGGNLPPVNAFLLITNGISISGSCIGNPTKDIPEMLQLAADKKIKPWVQPRPMREANQAIVDFEAGKPRYRYVLVNENFGKH